jgi:16S rRNA G966 N2-methylase RsmD
MKASGMFRATVTDTSTFPTTGKIKIHIHGIGHPDAIEMCSILSPFGGLANMGMQAVPPIGAEGVVLFEREDDDFPVWMGSILVDHGKSLEKGNAHPVEATDETDFIIKTQYTTKKNQDVTDTGNKVENVLRMSDKDFTLAHLHQTDKYKYETKAYNLNKNFPANTITISDTEIRFKVRTPDDSEDRYFVVDGTQLKLEWGSDQSITVNKDKTTIINGNSQIVLKKDGTIEMPVDKIILGGTKGHGMIYETFRDFVNAFNSHTHGTPSGPSSPPMAAFTNASDGKSEHVQLS